MASKPENYIAEGKALDSKELEIAALALQQIDESEQVEVDSPWEDVVTRRLEELKSGKVEAVNGRETREMGRSLLAQRRR
ncbi:addiction module protein [Ruania zhangjianzhongii]|uniref:addiction module protein n=1 Tax=Ruania zhangjianzhongii TaxID=2603206 RepID=UPI0011CB7155|nr:addiction module protein [Ruania zhangjianzhongii]